MNKIFKSEIIASTDIHAGGHLFGLLFQKVLKFEDDGTIILSKQVVDSFNPLDKRDIVHLNDYKISGTWQKIETNKIMCFFQTIFIEMNGIESPNKQGRLIFHCFDSRLNKQWGEVYSEVSETT